MLKNRKGDTLIELIVATALFAMLLSSIFMLPNFIRTAGQESADRLSALAKILVAKQTVRAEWTSAERMQAGNVTPGSITSIAFKKDYSPYGQGGQKWVKYEVSGDKLLRNGTDVLSDAVIKSKMQKIGSNYFLMSFYAPNGTKVGSNTGDVPTVQGVNDAATAYWTMSILFQYDSFPQVISATRMVTPDFETPVPDDSHTFSVPMDTTKYGKWTNAVTTKDDLSVLGDSDIEKYSSFLGIPAKWKSEFINLRPTATGFAGTLYDPVRNKGIADALVYAYTPDNHSYVTTTQNDGSFFFVGNFNTGALVVYYGGDVYNECKAQYRP